MICDAFDWVIVTVAIFACFMAVWVMAHAMTSPLYNICTRCGRRGHCAASCKEPINAALTRRP